jgi:hypothetical protein
MVEHALCGWETAYIHNIVEIKILHLDGPGNVHPADKKTGFPFTVGGRMFTVIVMKLHKQIENMLCVMGMNLMGLVTFEQGLIIHFPNHAFMCPTLLFP